VRLVNEEGHRPNSTMTPFLGMPSMRSRTISKDGFIQLVTTHLYENA